MLNINHQYKKQNPYVVNEVLGATPEKLLLKVYDFAIVHCERKDISKANQAVQELINALNFNDEEAQPISNGLLRLYQFCQDQIRKQEFQTAKEILVQLKSTWVEAFSQSR